MRLYFLKREGFKTFFRFCFIRIFYEGEVVMLFNIDEVRKLLKGYFKLFIYFKINEEGRSFRFLYLFKFMFMC